MVPKIYFGKRDKMKIVKMKCNHIVNPLGYELSNPVLSWIIETEHGQGKLSCRVVVARDKNFQMILHDSEIREDIEFIGYRVNESLEPCTRYYWRVSVWVGDESCDSPISWFETGKMYEPWIGKWITPSWEDKELHPLFRKKFSIEKEVSKARLYVSGLGLYHAEINGKKVSEEYFAPFCNSYDNWIQYQTYDVTSILQKGENIIGAMMGNGWYKGRFGFDGRAKGYYGEDFSFIGELVLLYTDGTKDIIITDESWNAKPSHIIEGNIYDGECQNGEKYEEDWSVPGASGDGWQGVTLLNGKTELLEERRSLPVYIKEQIAPMRIIHTPKNEIVIDMGQNMTGWVKFRNHNSKGSQIYLQYGEEMQEGCFYRENLRSAKAEFTYISDGMNREIQPYFTYYGFRYVKVEGIEGTLDINDFTGCVVYSDLETTGYIETSNRMVNKLFQNALWGQKGNFLDVPTDCPQRDERMGWTGDAQMFSGTACYNMDSNAFFRKYLYDLAKEQKRFGVVPHVVPSFGMTKVEDNSFCSGGSCGWADAAVIIPWNLYLHYGDKTVLENQFESMVSYIEYIRKQDDGSRLWKTGFHFGDWLALDGESEFNPSGGTKSDLIATAYYAYSSEIVAKAAKVIGQETVAREYFKLSKEVKESFCKEYITDDGELTVDTQTAHILVLFMNLAPKEVKEKVVKSLRENLKRNNNYLKTGFIGTPYFSRVLSENGCNDLAYQLLLNEEYPSWLYEVKMGATTVWERWNSILPDGKFGELGMNSLNHYAYGSIVEWMYRNMCGIHPLEECPGFRKIHLEPQPDRRIEYAKAVVDSAAGVIESGWRYESNKIHYHFLIPAFTKAEVILPNGLNDIIAINGLELDKIDFEREIRNGRHIIYLCAGDYEIYANID